jgi:hypothetical protein
VPVLAVHPTLMSKEAIAFLALGILLVSRRGGIFERGEELRP